MNHNPNPSETSPSIANKTTMVEEQVGQVKREIIDHYDTIQSQIDIRTETLLMNLPEAMKRGREELLERVKEEKEKSLAALGPDSALVRYKNEYYERFMQLREDYYNSGNDLEKKEDIQKRLEELKKDIQLLEDFLDDFKNRALSFEEADKSVYASLIGELVSNQDEQTNLIEYPHHHHIDY
jgi:hypothetical protein